MHFPIDTFKNSSAFILFLGVINKGDSFRRRRSRSNSLAPHAVQALQQQQQQQQLQQEMLQTVPATPHDASSYRVAMVGTQGVGKTALISQFMTSECINAYDQGKRQLSDDKGGSIMIKICRMRGVWGKLEVFVFAVKAGLNGITPGPFNQTSCMFGCIARWNRDPYADPVGSWWLYKYPSTIVPLHCFGWSEPWFFYSGGSSSCSSWSQFTLKLKNKTIFFF